MPKDANTQKQRNMKNNQPLQVQELVAAGQIISIPRSRWFKRPAYLYERRSVDKEVGGGPVNYGVMPVGRGMTPSMSDTLAVGRSVGWGNRLVGR